MSSWALHHFFRIAVVLLVGVWALVTLAVRRGWPLLLPFPLALALLAWTAWEFAGEAAPFAAAIAILGYLGIAIGLGWR